MAIACRISTEAKTSSQDLPFMTVGASAINPNRKIFEARKRETAALGAGEKLVLGYPLAACAFYLFIRAHQT